MKTFIFIRDDIAYNFFMKVDVSDSMKLQELVRLFKDRVKQEVDWYYSPEYFKIFLEEHGIAYSDVDNLEQVYWGG